MGLWFEIALHCTYATPIISQINAENKGVFKEHLNKEKVISQKETLGLAQPQAKMRKGVGFKTVVLLKKEVEEDKSDGRPTLSHDLTAESCDNKEPLI